MRWLKAGTVIGVGLGGFADGIALHQIAQWHNMGSAVLPPVTMEAMSRNMVWDGLFHAAVWWVTGLGIVLLWRALRERGTRVPGRAFAGALLAGWGLFNLLEGLIDHHLLQLHHVYERAGLSSWDWLFLASGAALIAAGWFMVASGSRRSGH